jgi:uncharacterized membrane protein YbhN (UPF0104 family)
VLLSGGLARDWRKLLAYQFVWRSEYLLPAFGWYSLAMVCLIINWRLLLRSTGAHSPLWRDATAYSYSFLTSGLPGGFWSVFSLLYFYQQIGVGRVTVIVAISLEQLTLLLAALVVGLVAAPFTIGQQLGPWGYAALGGSAALLTLCCTPPVIRRIVGALIRFEPLAPLSNISIGYGGLLRSMALQALVIVCSSQVVFALSNLIDAVPVAYLPAIIASWAVITVVSSILYWMPGSAGFQVFVTSLTLGAFLPLPVLLAVLILLRLTRIVGGLVWALLAFCLFDLPQRRSAKDLE